MKVKYAKSHAKSVPCEVRTMIHKAPTVGLCLELGTVSLAELWCLVVASTVDDM